MPGFRYQAAARFMIDIRPLMNTYCCLSPKFVNFQLHSNGEDRKFYRRSPLLVVDSAAPLAGGQFDSDRLLIGDYAHMVSSRIPRVASLIKRKPRTIFDRTPQPPYVVATEVNQG
jgi:hypothetical protein